jgi:hypothetical protein
VTGFLVTAIVIVAIVSLLVAYAIKKLSSTPLRIVAVISAITTLVVALPKVFDSLRPPATAPGVQAPATVSPAPAASPQESTESSAPVAPYGSTPPASPSGTASSDAAALPAVYLFASSEAVA